MQKTAPKLYDFSANRIDGKPISMGEFRGRVLLIVNTASDCGFTPQYRDLEELFERLKSRGLVVLGFPCNQFGGQEPGPDLAIAQFCSSKYQVTFPLFSKVDVNGPSAHPLFPFLKRSTGGFLWRIGLGDIRWNFTKFLVDRNGRVVSRHAPSVRPSRLTLKIERLLEQT